VTSTAFVLGAGGVVGSAYLAGALQACVDDGWDPESADLIVGTSAGASTGATLRAGIPVTDVYAGQTGGEISEATLAVRDRLPPPLDFSERPGFRLARPQAPRLLGRAVIRRGLPRVGLAVGGLTPRGTMDSQRVVARIDGVHPDGWPERPFWACAVRLTDGKLRAFGRDPSDATVGEAVAASMAVPGILAPVRIDGADHVDGALHSPTNADLVAGLGFDRVVVVSPMSGTTDLRHPARAYHTWLLRREVAAVRAAGSEVVVVEPTADDLTLMGGDAMRPGREQAVAETARRSAAGALG
jgi:NTE family protein